MTNTPETRKIVNRETHELTTVFESPEIQNLLPRLQCRESDRRFFSLGKPGHAETIEQWTEVFTDAVEVRIRIQNFRHSDGKVIRSIQRIVTDEFDFRLPMPHATAASKFSANLRKKQIKKAKKAPNR